MHASRYINISFYFYLIIGERMIIQEQSRRDIKCDKHINRIMLMGRQYEENAKHIQQPCHRMQKVEMPRCICNEKNENQHVK